MTENNNNNNSNNTNIFNFKGQVKVSDVQAAFDELIGRINEIADIYNQTDVFIQKQDYSVGGDSLGASGYTLTVGGIKQILSAYNGTLFGCRAFRINSNQVLITDGVFITQSKPIRIRSQVLTGTGNVICVDLEAGTVSLNVTGDVIPEGLYPIAYLGTASTDNYLNCHRGVQLEGLKDYYITTPNKWFARFIDPDDPSAHRFQGAGVFFVNSGGADRITYQDQVTIAEGWARNNRRGVRAKRAHISIMPFNMLFIPKGCNTPLWPSGRNHTSRTFHRCDLHRGT